MADDYIMGTEIYTTQRGDFSTKGTQKILNVFFVVDISGSMRNEGRIQAVNEAFTQMVPALRQVQLDCMSEFELRIAIMTFDQNARWIVAPTPVLEYTHEEIACSQWVTYFSEAFRTLGEKLTKNAYMAHTGKIAKPYIMLLTDGEPTEEDNYQPELDRLLENGWFREALRFAVLIGKDTINSPRARAAVARFVVDPEEGIINAADAAAIAAEVQAKTIHTVVNMTRHNVTGDHSNENSGNSGVDVFDTSGNGGFNGSAGNDSGNGGFGNFGFGDFGDFGGFDDGSFI